MFYRRVLCTTLQKHVEENLAAPVSDQLSILEELAIMRQIASESVQVYAVAIEGLKDKNNKEAENLRIMAGQLCADSLKMVADFCEKAARIDSLQRDKFSIHTINSVVAQITNMFHSVCEKSGNRELAEAFEEKVRNELRVPAAINNTNSGTSLTPDQDVTEMDDTVPKEEE